jgi:hypothetical protein
MVGSAARCSPIRSWRSPTLCFDRILVINQKNIRREWLLGYIGNNAEEFEAFGECCDVVIRALARAQWTSDYSRRLLADTLPQT